MLLGIKELARLSLAHSLPAIVITPTVNRSYTSLDKALSNLYMAEKHISKLNSRKREPVLFVNGFSIQKESIETVRKLQGSFVGLAFSCDEENIRKIERASCFKALIIAAWVGGYDYFNNNWNPMLLNNELLGITKCYTSFAFAYSDASHVGLVPVSTALGFIEGRGYMRITKWWR